MTLPSGNPLADAALARSLDGDFSSRHAEVDGVRLHYVEGGAGAPLLLLGGWPQTWWQWNKVMPALARRHRVIAVDLRGMGGSAKPEDGYDKRTMARDIRELGRHLGLETYSIVGHDIGAMVAYAHAALFPEATTKIALLDVSHPDEHWSEFRLIPEQDQRVDPVGAADGRPPYLWWFALNQVRDLPERLLEGRTRSLVDWLCERLAADPDSVDEHARQVYAHAYSSADAIRAGNGWYQTFPADIVDERAYGTLSVPILALAGVQGNYAFLRDVLPGKGTDVRVIEVADCGHYIAEEQPQAVIDALGAFLR
ncbi:pimeloyl-ACP methyl ester carboxylesterase [Actinoalloteichus hoggarensis]|uniref:Soluble epoxide hydrolase n=1 Tax=Actinoalloteichus hoggarensis TaxID=1470176 RepID=A0A221VXK9_9PSEU|nr:alpha/beta hydrolase [Actinoalloteichus hoggarensis]ASO18290.1 Soluble epoxide hydrolase [Actinoalloteichus hoggarensis]MBB5921652.1 pimeloyl-ACP methyl ester carboxylesterase [Actinoalloteichus hoggarensis]